ncbi:MAG: MarR family transcriptional regulator [Candidatus Aminicenantes bacterium]|nr:MarR family transcriptional regulator [Candidatus Aminicenantes bacterium]
MRTKQIRLFRKTLRRLERELSEILKSGCECCDVSLVQCHTLMELDRLNEVGITELAEAMDLDKSTVSRGVEALVGRNLVHREIDSNNRRSVRVFLTQDGKDVCCRINKLSDGYYQELFQHIPEDKHPVVLEGLELFTRAQQEVRRLKINRENGSIRSDERNEVNP